MTTALGDLRPIDSFHAQPGKSAQAYANLSYTLAEALADLIDNSIDAKANAVYVTFHHDDNEILSVSTADDGTGMSMAQLKAALQFFTERAHDREDLGVFGVGMKWASLSQARTVTVISKQNNIISACQWTFESIDNSYEYFILNPDDARRAFTKAYPKGKVPPHGTVVVWERLTRLSTRKGEVEVFLQDQCLKLATDLGITFHRFLDRGLSLRVDVKHVEEPLSIPFEVMALDPFGYEEGTGKAGYPKTFFANIPGFGQLDLIAHIWPAGVRTDEFLLGRNQGSRSQGFYFYRNDRLIQRADWFGILRNRNETELQLARIQVNLPNEIPATNPQKTRVQLTQDATRALTAAVCGSITLERYLADACDAFNRYKVRTGGGALVPRVMGKGVPAKLRRLTMKKGIKEPIDFKWKRLPPDLMFELGEDVVLLNSRYRSIILGGDTPSATDALVLKTLLFLLLRDYFDKERFSKKRKELLEYCNKLLCAAVRVP